MAEEKLTDMFPTGEESVKEGDAFAPEKEEAKPEEKEPELNDEQLEEIKNRRQRRLESRLQQEREANIALTARLAALSEAQKFREETGAVSEPDEMIARIYGTNTPEAQEATRLLQQALSKSTDKAVEKALAKFQETLQEREGEVAKEEKTLDSFMESIEDEYGVDLTGDTPDSSKARDGFLDMLERLSPKRNGEIVEYADPIETWEAYSRLNKPSNERAQRLASRSSTRSGLTPDNADSKEMEHYLRQEGII